jgi:hypothetical protein
MSFTPDVTDAMREYLRRVPPITGVPPAAAAVRAEDLLTALAFAEAPGVPAALWRTALSALGIGNVREGELIGFARSSAASFLVESAGADGETTTFRLFHQALNDALLTARAGLPERANAVRANDERTLTRAFFRVGQDSGWEHAPAYLLRSLPTHAARAGLVDELLADDAYLLHADLRQLLRVTDGAATEHGRRRARLVATSHPPSHPGCPRRTSGHV